MAIRKAKAPQGPLGCFACKSAKIVPEFTAELIKSWSCDNCGAVFSDPVILSPEEWEAEWQQRLVA